MREPSATSVDFITAHCEEAGLITAGSIRFARGVDQANGMAHVTCNLER